VLARLWRVGCSMFIPFSELSTVCPTRKQPWLSENAQFVGIRGQESKWDEEFEVRGQGSQRSPKLTADSPDLPGSLIAPWFH
jgi:hypothetical protein